VAPPRFIGVNAIFGPEVWIPAVAAERLSPNELRNALTDRGKPLFTGIGRLNPGVSRQQAGADLAAIAAALAREFPRSNEGHTVAVRPIREVLMPGGGGAAPVIFAGVVLSAVVGLVLLIACSNVANLLLARSSARRQEIAVRLAMGASRRRLVRQLLTESVLLGLLSGAAGLFFGYAGLRALFGQLPSAANFATPKMDLTVFLFALAVSVLTGLLFGTIPALKVSRADVAAVLKEEARTTGRSRRRITAGNALVVGQVALSFLLLVTAALCLRSIERAYRMDPGFQTARLATFMTRPGQAGYTKTQTEEFYKSSRERVLRVPGVDSVSWASNLPLWSRPSGGLEIEGYQPRSKDDSVRAIVTSIEPDYFATAGVAIESGRNFSTADRETTAPVAIVNEKMARDFWPEGALGKRVRLPGEQQMRQVVGIARTANYSTLGEAPQFCVYVPMEQKYSDAMVLFVRSRRDPREILAPVERELRGSGDENLVSDVRTGAVLIDGGLFQARMAVSLLAVFGLLALGLAGIGLYGILAYSVNQRRREIGLRMALGATPSSVLGMVVRQGMSMVGIGVLIGYALSIPAGRLLSGMLYGVSPSDPASVAAAAATLSLVAFLACYLPARLATRVDPLRALHEV
jgi:predicted permease